MKNKQGVANACERLGIPADAVVRMPRIQLVGSISLYAENYELITEYTDKRMILAAKDGFVEISGSGLRIAEACGRNLSVKGNIASVIFTEN